MSIFISHHWLLLVIKHWASDSLRKPSAPWLLWICVTRVNYSLKSQLKEARLFWLVSYNVGGFSRKSPKRPTLQHFWHLFIKRKLLKFNWCFSEYSHSSGCDQEFLPCSRSCALYQGSPFLSKSSSRIMSVNILQRRDEQEASPVKGPDKQVCNSVALAAENGLSSSTTTVHPPGVVSVNLSEPLSMLCTATWHYRADTPTSGRWQI